jgi:hypothetical protein
MVSVQLQVFTWYVNIWIVANARIEGLTTDLGMTGNQYLTGLTLYFIGYVLFEVSCSSLLHEQ